MAGSTNNDDTQHIIGVFYLMDFSALLSQTRARGLQWVKERAYNEHERRNSS
jgi:hypothetical protein